MPKQKNLGAIVNTMRKEASQLQAALPAKIIQHMMLFEKLAEEFSEDDYLSAHTFIWDTVAKYAEKKSDACWARLENENIIEGYKELVPGTHVVHQSSRFEIECKVTNPVQRFNPSVLAELFLKSKYKVPTAITLQKVDEAKVGDKSNRMLSIKERGV